MTQFHTAVIALSTTDKSGPKPKRVFDRYYTFYYPTLDMVSEELPTPDQMEEVKVTGGEEPVTYQTPIYSDPKLQYAQDALISVLATNARNAAKGDDEAPSDWESLFTAKDSAKFGTVFKAWKEGMQEYLGTTAYTEAQQAAVLANLDIRKIAGMADAYRDKLLSVVNAYHEALDDDSAHELRSAINAITNALEARQDSLDFL